MTLSAGFIGLGQMGNPMASNLIRHQVEVSVFNRTKQAASGILGKGAKWADSPNALIEKAPVVFSMVANDEALKTITLGEGGLLAKERKGAIHVSMSTVSPDLIAELALLHQKMGITLLSAPVFGRPEAAEAQKLWIALAGDPEAKKRVQPLLLFMGQKIFDFGERPEMANAIKLAGNFMILSQVEMFAEAFAFVEKTGADPRTFFELLSQALFPSTITKGYGERVIKREFEPAGFRMDLGLKDINLLLRAGNAANIPLPLADLLHQRLLSGIAKGRKEMDWSAISLSVFDDAGLELPSE